MSSIAVTHNEPARLEIESLSHLPWRYRAMVRRVRDFEMQFVALTDERIKQVINRVRRLVREGEELDAHLPKIFAAVCVVAKRTIGLRPFNVQIIGGYELHRGAIAEMATGEGKTLVATLPATLNAIGGRGVHIVTVNDYLAQRDAQTMGSIYKTLGLTVGVIVSGMDDTQRRAAYRCDIVYGTNKEFGFDYLRDQIKLHDARQTRPIDTLSMLHRAGSQEPVMRQLHYAIVDEADSILIDESRTPLVIAAESGPSPLAWAYQWADQLAQRFRARHDFDLKIDKRLLSWKEEGRARLEKVLKQTNTPSMGGGNWPDLVLNALRARWLFARDQQYVIAGDEVVIVDEFTGRRMPGRTWSEGLHQAVQAKERLPIMAPADTLARTTYQYFFGLYMKLAGMSGTAITESAEFKSVYKLRVVQIPTHRTVRRVAPCPIASSALWAKNGTAWPMKLCASPKKAAPCWSARAALRKAKPFRACCGCAKSNMKRSMPGRKMQNAKPRSSPMPGSSALSPSPPTWPAAVPILNWAPAPPPWAACMSSARNGTKAGASIGN